MESQSELIKSIDINVCSCDSSATLCREERFHQSLKIKLVKHLHLVSML